MMYFSFGRLMSLTLLIALSACICGCQTSTQMIDVRTNLAVPPPASGVKIPLRAALDLSQIKGFTYSPSISYLPSRDTKPVGIGNALCTGSEKITRAIFREVSVIGSNSENSRSEADVIVIPRCLEIRYEIFKIRDVDIRVVVEWKVVKPDGKLLYLDTVTGEACRTVSVTLSGATREREQGEIYALSLEDQFSKAQTKLYADGWWRTD